MRNRTIICEEWEIFDDVKYEADFISFDLEWPQLQPSPPRIFFAGKERLYKARWEFTRFEQAFRG